MKLRITLLKLTPIILVSLLFQGAWAWPPLFGPEFNFTNENLVQAGRRSGTFIVSTNENKAARDMFWKQALAKCRGCFSREVIDRYGSKTYEITHPQKWSFVIALDPWVVEVQMSPMTLDQIIEAESEIQRLIFDTAAEIGLHPSDAAGHIHLGLESSFNGDTLLYRNFLVDWFTHSKMAYYLFGADSLNAPTVDMLGSRPQKNLQTILGIFDQQQMGVDQDITQVEPRGWFRQKWGQLEEFLGRVPSKELFSNTSNGRAIADLTSAIIQYVYYKTSRRASPPAKYQNLNLLHITGDPQTDTIELRSVHEVQRAKEYTLLARLMQGRLLHLKRINAPIPFDSVKRIDTIQEAVDLYAAYSGEAGLSWRDARQMLIEEYKGYMPTASAVNCADVFR